MPLATQSGYTDTVLHEANSLNNLDIYFPTDFERILLISVSALGLPAILAVKLDFYSACNSLQVKSANWNTLEYL